MKVKLIRGTERPEELVCECARNDYRGNGIIDYDFDELMESVEPDHRDLMSAGKHFDVPPAKYLAQKSAGWSEFEKWDNVDPNDVDDYLLREAKKRSLLKHLMRSGHWGPFEHPQATVAMEGVTRVLMAQITRHRHFTFDIMSLRYVGVDNVDDVEDRFQIPECVKDGEAVSREGVTEVDPEAQDEYIHAYARSIKSYRTLLDMGVPQEEARKVLPMGTKVNIVASANARAWMHILNVRTKANVQGETRRCAEAIFEELKDWMPFTFEYFDQNPPKGLNP